MSFLHAQLALELRLLVLVALNAKLHMINGLLMLIDFTFLNCTLLKNQALSLLYQGIMRPKTGILPLRVKTT
jgi:hypothetical protein